MDIKNMFQKIQNGIAFLKSKKFLNIASIFLTVFMLLNTLSVTYANAQSGTTTAAGTDFKIDMPESFTQIGKVGTHVQGEEEGVNSQKLSDNFLANSVFTGLTALSPELLSGSDAIGADNSIQKQNKGGLISLVNNQTYALFDSQPSVNVPIALGNEWVPGYKDNNLYAANDGYSFLSEIGIDALWEKTSLVAYVLFVIVLIAAGFMIMFRQKIGGQMAVTVFNALPNVILGLVLVPFSFAIIGLILNISVMATNVIAGVLGASNPVFVDNPFSLIGVLLSGNTPGITSWNTGGILAGIGGILGGIAGIFAGGPVGAVVGLAIGALIMVLVVVFIVGWASIKVYMTLLNAYLAIILDVVLAPLIIAFGSIPGQENLRTDMFIRILRNALIFPGVFLFLNLADFVLSDKVSITFPYGLAKGDWSTVNEGVVGIGSILKGFLAIALYFFASEVPTMLLDFLPANSGKGFGAAVDNVKKSLGKIPIVGSFFG